VTRFRRKRLENEHIERALNEVRWPHVPVSAGFPDTKTIYNDTTIIYKRWRMRNPGEAGGQEPERGHAGEGFADAFGTSRAGGPIAG